MKKLAVTAGALLLAGSVAAQSPPVATPPIEAVDPLRLSAARPVIDEVWPLGTYARIMNASMDQIMRSSMAGMYDMKVGDFAKTTGVKAGADSSGDGSGTIGDAIRKQDPYFDERMRRTMSVMTREMVKVMTDVEPQVRDALAHAYARRFTVDQLGQLRRFFATPTGSIYAADSMTMMMGPDMMQAMQSFAPKLVAEMPAIMAKVADATKDLPPPPKKKTP